ncbi:recombinase family protein [Pelosinus propionicus]|uniref:Site-specific DNA recombinase n=1 Tax=Pelosinus propionicus DSM 13327 TaxID=1123291 RepID=A0A1I4K4D5_9FIRM|nr:recombinase family protein [Pelosinus propionicus]SFL73336.1 Site-specific DNA recombinase [Pelosinus propionicus DSM 13327]
MNALYVRVSTDDQARKGYSLKDQIAACRNHLLAIDHTGIKEYVDDGYSGEYLERPALDKLRNDLQNGIIKIVAIYDPDRLSRNLTNQLIIAEEIEKTGAKITFVTGDYDSSPEGRLFFSMKGAISAYEKSKIRERTSRGRRAKAHQGKIISNAHPFGYDWDKKNSMYVINEEESKTIQFIYHLCIHQGYGSRRISLELARLGIVGKNNRPLSICTVSRILTKEMYYGQHYLFKQRTCKTGQNSREVKDNPPESWIPVIIPAIVTREMWESAQLQIQQNKKLATRNNKHNYLLRGLLHCALCGRSMTAYSRPAKRKNGSDKIYYYYSCISKESNTYTANGTSCQCRRIPVEDLEQAVWQCLVTLATSKDHLQEYIRTNANISYSEQITNLHTRQIKLQKKKNNTLRWYQENLIDSETVERELRNLNKELATIRLDISELTTIQEKTNQLATSPTDLITVKTFAEKRNVLLKLSYRIFAVRLNDSFEFYLEK